MRLIDADALIEEMKPEDEPKDMPNLLLKLFCNVIDNQPTVDAVEVKHARWIFYQRRNYSCCSECQSQMPTERWAHRKYCGCCGARMDGRREEGDGDA